MDYPLVFVLILATITFATAPAYSQMIYVSENPIAVGSTVTFTSQSNITTGAWIFNNDIIVIVFPGNVIINDNWKNRVTFNSTTSSLTIRSLQVEDSGLYTLQEVSSFHAEITLSVQVPIENVTLTANAVNLVEFNDTTVLTCSVSNGSSLTYVWLKHGVVIAASERVQFSDGGATLTIVRVTRYDEGMYRCNVSNGISNEISPPTYLNISYGPSNATMMIIPMRYVYRTGSNITLLCSAVSSPAAMIQWMLNGVSLNHYGHYLHLEMVTESSSGYYQCLFHNNFTSKVSSASTMIRIMEPLVAVVVNHTGAPAILHKSFTLYCEVTGPAETIQWWRNSQLISADNTTFFGMDNKTLILNPVQHSDNGDYQCQAFNSVSNITSYPYTVEVNYGPMKPVITGLSMALKGTLKNLTCSSMSHPPSHIRWYFNDSLVATTSQLMIGPLTLNMSGMYTCMAYNNVTGKNSTAYKMLKVFAPVTMASIKIVGPQPIENHTFTLTCDTAGDVETIVWMRGWYPLYPDNTTNFSMGNATLTFDPVMKSDNGYYQCVASNPLSSLSSETFMLAVVYGPQIANIMGPSMATTGDSVTLSCYASSNPPSSYEWFFNDSLVANTSQYVTPPLTIAMSGMYTCMAYNNVTGKNSTAYKMLKIFAPVTMASIKIVGPQPIENHTFTLTCDTVGDVETIVWMRGWYPLYPDNTTNFSMGNATLTFDPVMKSDNGYYQCVASNPLSSLSSETFMLAVFYGPQIANIMGPSMATTGDSVTLSCYASSNPPSSYEWFFNDSLVANTSQYVTPPLTIAMSGMYTCMAYNNVTGKNSTAYKMLKIFAPVTMASIKIVGPQPIENHTFTLTCDTAGDVESIMWMRGWYPLYPDNTTNFSMGNATLTFDPVMKSDNGYYQCVASNPLSSLSSETFMLAVFYGPQITNIIETPMNPAIEGHSYTLKCNVTGPFEHIYWMKNGDLLHEDNRTVFYMDNKTVTFNPLKKYDSGNYQCMAINAFVNRTSPPYRLIVNFGPETIIIDGPAFATFGKYAVFHCSAMSVPDSQFSWWFNGTEVANTSVFTTAHLSFNMSGEYTCMADNKVTGKTSTNSTMLTVIAAIESVMVRSNTVPISSENFTLTCEVTGPYDTIYWMKDNTSMETTMANTNMSYYTENNMLHFTPVTMYNDGIYHCVASNQASSHKSPQYMLLVNYGPLKVYIDGPNSQKVGYPVNLKCSADSRPDCDFYWFFNQSTEALKVGSVLTFSATKEREGNYTCKARNPVTNVTMYQTKAFTITDHASALHIPSQGGLMVMGIFALSVTVVLH